MSHRVAAMRNTVEPMKLAAATSWAADSASLFTSRSPVSIPARVRPTQARPTRFAHTVRLARMDLTSFMMSPF